MFRKNSQKTEKQGWWASARRGWITSIILGMVILILPFKDIILSLIKAPQTLDQLAAASPFWQAVVKNGVTDNIGALFEGMLPFAIVGGGCILFSYAVVSGYLMTYRALEVNDSPDPAAADNIPLKPGNIAFSNIVLRSLVVNVPMLYWAFFLFVGLPQLIKLPIASLSTGSIAALVGACVLMVIVAILATHIGKALTRRTLRLMARAQ